MTLHSYDYSTIKKDVSYRSLDADFQNGVIACGFMPKSSVEHSQYNFCIDYYSGFLLLQGSGTYITEDGSKILIKAGDFVQRFPGITHSTVINTDNTWVEFFISIGKSSYEYLSSLNLISRSPVNHFQLLPQLLEYYKLLSCLKEASLEQLPMYLLDLQRILIQWSSNSSISEGIVSVSPIMELACHKLSIHFDQPINYHLLSKSLGLSYEVFRKKFKQATGFSPHQYRIYKCMHQACILLRSGVSIKETAILSGYADTYAFTKQFSRSIGISPGRYIVGTTNAMVHNTSNRMLL